MQQTEKYALNLIETSDPFSPASLNENAQKTEAALSEVSETAAGLDSRVAVLEADKVKLIFGSYVGNGDKDRVIQTINLGVTPMAVFFPTTTSALYMITAAIPIIDSYCNLKMAEIVEGGFQVVSDHHSFFNIPGTVYHFVALV